MCRDRSGEIWRRSDNGENIVGEIKRSMVGATLRRGFCQFATEGTPYEKWVHFVRVTSPTSDVKHRKWSEDSDQPWELFPTMERIS